MNMFRNHINLGQVSSEISYKPKKLAKDLFKLNQTNVTEPKRNETNKIFNQPKIDIFILHIEYL